MIWTWLEIIHDIPAKRVSGVAIGGSHFHEFRKCYASLVSLGKFTENLLKFVRKEPTQAIIDLSEL